MIHELHIRLHPEELGDEELLYKIAVRDLDIRIDSIKHIEVLKRSIDARKPEIKYNLKLAVYQDEEFVPTESYFFPAINSLNRTVHIIGAGPGGLFAALCAIENGIKPILYERGKDVRSRRRDLVKIHREHKVDSESNYCFGEGGAGTYSDGKLYTRSKKRGNVKKVLEWLVHFGADRDILVNAHPHVGTNKLPGIIAAIREEIIRCGGEVHFNSKMTDIEVVQGKLKSITINESAQILAEDLILATGHSARDIFYLLHKKGINIEAKPFALGVRIEHPQSLINSIQYHGREWDENLPPAAYSLVTQAKGMGVYSFCMCPGGIVAPCATEEGEVVTNGWSPSKRNNSFANSGMVVQVEPEQLPNYNENDPFVCLNFQKEVEKACWEAGGKSQRVPAQRLIDFIENKKSSSLPETSYQPGIVSVNLHDVLPELISSRLRLGFIDFGKKMKGFLTNEAVLHAPESRTSSPVKIPRHQDTLMHIDVEGLYPCGEGAGYAGGIVSAAVDGMNCIQKIVEKYSHPN